MKIADDKSPRSEVSIPVWSLFIILTAGLFLMYSSSFTTDYLMNDELSIIGQKSDPMLVSIFDFFRTGRPFAGISRTLAFNYAELDPGRIQHIRFLNICFIVFFGIALMYFLWKRSRNPLFSFFVILLFMSQLSVQAVAGYSLVLIGFHFAIWLSLGAFYLYFYKDKHVSKAFLYTIILLMFLTAMHTFQVFAFFCMIPLSYYILSSKNLKVRRIIVFLGLAVAGFLFSFFVFRLAVHNESFGTYYLVKDSLEGLRNPGEVLTNALNPMAYWSSFKIWTYPYPFHNLAPLGKLKITLAMIMMGLWLSVNGGAFFIEWSRQDRKQKKQIIIKWMLVLVCLLFCGVFILADSPVRIINHRAHVVLPFAGVVLFMAAYSLQVLASRFRSIQSKVVTGTVITLIILTAFGAQRGLSQGIVDLRQNQLNFVRTELSSKTKDNIRQVIVVIPEPFRYIRLHEPSEIWFGQILSHPRRLAKKSLYIYAMHTLGMESENRDIIILSKPPESIPSDAVIIDWAKYIRAHLLRIKDAP